MSYLPTNPPIITREFSCTDAGSGPEGGRQGALLWEGRCAGLNVQSWPHVNHILEIIDKDDPSGGQNTMSIIPTPSKPIHFGKVKSVQLRQWFKIPLLVDWRIVLEAFIDPIFGMVHSSSQGHAQWKPFARDQGVTGEGYKEYYFYAWADGILRYTFKRSAGNWSAVIYSTCEAGSDYSLAAINHALAPWQEADMIKARVTAGRKYKIYITHDDIAVQTFNLDLGIIKDPIDQT